MNHIETLVDAIKTNIHQLNFILDMLEIEATQLMELDPVNATPSYHRDAHGRPRYLWLIHPQVNGDRIREYIGSKPERIDAALVRVQAQADLVEAQRQAADVKARLGLITRYLEMALQVAKGGENREN